MEGGGRRQGAGRKVEEGERMKRKEGCVWGVSASLQHELGASLVEQRSSQVTMSSSGPNLLLYSALPFFHTLLSQGVPEPSQV